MTTIEQYLIQVDPESRTALEQVVALVRQTVPEVSEGIAYGVPALIYKSMPLLAFRVNAQHIGLYPCSGAIISQLKDELTEFSVAAGTVRFSPDHPIPEKTLIQMLKLRQAEIDQKAT